MKTPLPAVMLVVLCVQSLAPAQHKPTSKPKRSLAEGLVRQWIETQDIQPLFADSGLEMATGKGPIALILRQKDGGLRVVPLRRGFGEHGARAQPVRTTEQPREVDLRNPKRPVPGNKPRSRPTPKDGTKKQVKPGKGDGAKRKPTRSGRPPQIRLLRSGRELRIFVDRQKTAHQVGEQLDRKALRQLFDKLHKRNVMTTAAHQLQITPNADTLLQDFLTVWQVARQAGFRSVGMSGTAGAVMLDETDRATVAAIPKNLGWKKRGMLANGELLILLDREARWGDTVDLVVQCAQAGIWQLAFVVQKDRYTRFKIPTHLPVDPGL